MITLDGNPYKIFGNAYKITQSTPRVVEVGGSGKVCLTDAAFVYYTHTMTLILDTTSLHLLQATAARFATALDYIDMRGIEWNPEASGTGILNTGAFYANPETVANPHLVKTYLGNRFLVDLRLVINSEVEHAYA